MSLSLFLKCLFNCCGHTIQMLYKSGNYISCSFCCCSCFILGFREFLQARFLKFRFTTLVLHLLQPRNGPSTSPTCMCHLVLYVTGLVSLITCGSILLHPEALETMRLWMSLAIIRSTRSRFNFLPRYTNVELRLKLHYHTTITLIVIRADILW